MGVIYLPERYCVSVGDVEMVSIDYTDHLDSGELLTGTPTITEQTTSHLTLGNKAVSTAILTIKGRSVAVGAAVQFSVSGQQADTSYEIRVSVGTDASPARTIVRGLWFDTE